MNKYVKTKIEGIIEELEGTIDSTYEDGYQDGYDVMTTARDEIMKILDALYGEIKAVWKIDDKDEWLKSVKKDFEKIRKLMWKKE